MIRQMIRFQLQSVERCIDMMSVIVRIEGHFVTSALNFIQSTIY